MVTVGIEGRGERVEMHSSAAAGPLGWDHSEAREAPGMQVKGAHPQAHARDTGARIGSNRT